MSISNSKYHCPCGSIIKNNKYNINGHKNTKKHKIYENNKPGHTYLPKEIQNIIIEYCNDYTSEWWSLACKLAQCYASVQAGVEQKQTIKYIDMVSQWSSILDRIAYKIHDLFKESDTRCFMFDHITIGVNRDEREYYDTVEEHIKCINKYIAILFKSIDNIPNWHDINKYVEDLKSYMVKYKKRLVRVNELAKLDSDGLKQLKYIRQRPCYWKGRR
jgi:hypothetical protein